MPDYDTGAVYRGIDSMMAQFEARDKQEKQKLGLVRALLPDDEAARRYNFASRAQAMNASSDEVLAAFAGAIQQQAQLAKQQQMDYQKLQMDSLKAAMADRKVKADSEELFQAQAPSFLANFAANTSAGPASRAQQDNYLDQMGNPDTDALPEMPQFPQGAPRMNDASAYLSAAAQYPRAGQDPRMEALLKNLALARVRETPKQIMQPPEGWRGTGWRNGVMTFEPPTSPPTAGDKLPPGQYWNNGNIITVPADKAEPTTVTVTKKDDRGNSTSRKLTAEQFAALEAAEPPPPKVQTLVDEYKDAKYEAAKGNVYKGPEWMGFGDRNKKMTLIESQLRMLGYDVDGKRVNAPASSPSRGNVIRYKTDAQGNFVRE